jgi:hypothetical protein
LPLAHAAVVAAANRVGLQLAMVAIGTHRTADFTPPSNSFGNADSDRSGPIL